MLFGLNAGAVAVDISSRVFTRAKQVIFSSNFCPLSGHLLISLTDDSDTILRHG